MIGGVASQCKPYGIQKRQCGQHNVLTIIRKRYIYRLNGYLHPQRMLRDQIMELRDCEPKRNLRWMFRRRCQPSTQSLPP